MDILFEIDKDEEEIYLHFGDTRIVVASDPEGYDKFVEVLAHMSQEIKETYYDGEPYEDFIEENK